MKLALLGAKIGPNLFAVISPWLATLFLCQWHPKGTFPPCHPRSVTRCTKNSSCPEGVGSRGLPQQISRNDQDKRLLWVTLPVKAGTWCFKSHLCSKLHVDTTSLLSIVCVYCLWGFLRVFWKLMDMEERLQYYKSLRGQCWAPCCQHYEPDQHNPTLKKNIYFCKSSSVLCRWNIMSMIYHYQKDGPFSKIFFALVFWSGLNCGPLYAWHDLHGFRWYCHICPVNFQVMC